MIATLSKDQFIDALRDDDVKLKIRQLRPQTLQRALEIALEMESYSLAARKQRGQTSREVRLETVPKQRAAASTATNVGQGKTLLKLQECLQALQKEQQAAPSNKGQEERGAKITCWNCRKKGHYRRDCPQQSAEKAGSQSTPREEPANLPPRTESGNGQ